MAREQSSQVLLTLRSKLKVPFHLANKNVTLALLQFVKYNDARNICTLIFKKVKEPLETVSVVLSQMGRVRAFSIRWNDACKGTASESRANVQRFFCVYQFGLR